MLFTGFICSCSKVNFLHFLEFGSGTLVQSPSCLFMPLSCYFLDLTLVILSDLTSKGGVKSTLAQGCVLALRQEIWTLLQSLPPRALSCGMELGVNMVSSQISLWNVDRVRSVWLSTLNCSGARKLPTSQRNIS